MDLRRHRSLGGLCASITPRYQTATFRPMRAPLLPRYAPSDRMRLRTAANRVRIGRRGDALRSSTWQSLCATPFSQPQRSTNERTCDGVYSPSTGTSATRLSFLSLRDSGLALHPSLARGHFLARFCTAVFPLAGGGSITVSLVVSNGRSAPKASHLIGSSLP